MLARYDSLTARVGYKVPIPAQAFAQVFDMSVRSRFFDDASRVLDRMGVSDETRQMRQQLAQERAKQPPPGFIPLEIPSRRPRLAEAKDFLGRWKSESPTNPHEVEIRAAGDTIVVHDLVRFPNGETYEGKTARWTCRAKCAAGCRSGRVLT